MRRSWVCLLFLAACGGSEQPPATEGAFTSNSATLYDFAFQGEVEVDASSGAAVAGDAWNLAAQQAITAQMQYTVGQLNGELSVGRFSQMTIALPRDGKPAAQTRDSRTVLRYQAVLPVAWGRAQAPDTYDLVLPRTLAGDGVTRFFAKYGPEGHRCFAATEHGVSASGFWFDYRPQNCDVLRTAQAGAEDVVVSRATVKLSAENTQGKYPEYTRIWEDDTLHMVVVFGKADQGGGQLGGDSGIASYNDFIGQLKTRLALYEPKTRPDKLGFTPSDASHDIEINAVIPRNGKPRKVRISVLLVEAMREAAREDASTPPSRRTFKGLDGKSFVERYNELSTTADFISYNGHAGLGGNVQAISKLGQFAPNQYTIIFLNGCDTFAYLDGSLALRHKTLTNDPTGSAHLDIVSTALPQSFSPQSFLNVVWMSSFLDAFVEPKTYPAILRALDPSATKILAVTGEDDNVFAPGAPVGTR